MKVRGEASVKIFNEEHEMFRAAVRSFVDKEVAPHIEAWEAAGQIPKSIWPRMGELGFLGVAFPRCRGQGEVGGRGGRFPYHGGALRGAGALALRLARHGRRRPH